MPVKTERDLRLNPAIAWLLVIAAVLTFGYLLRNVPVPPDCLTQPEHPACKGR